MMFLLKILIGSKQIDAQNWIQLERLCFASSVRGCFTLEPIVLVGWLVGVLVRLLSGDLNQPRYFEVPEFSVSDAWRQGDTGELGNASGSY